MGTKSRKDLLDQNTNSYKLDKYGQALVSRAVQNGYERTARLPRDRAALVPRYAASPQITDLSLAPLSYLNPLSKDLWVFDT